METKKYLKLNDIEAYKIAFNLSNYVWDVVIKWEYFTKTTIGKQFVDSTDSISANIAEGFGRGSRLDNARFTKIARASLFEPKHWLMQANARRLLRDDVSSRFIERIENLIPRISAYINYLKKTENE